MLRLVLAFFLCAGCAAGNLTSSAPVSSMQRVSASGVPACEYLNVFVSMEGPPRSADPETERLRRMVLAESAEALSQLGPRIVQDRADAYWRLHADGLRDRRGNVLVHVGMQGELKLHRDMFVVMTAGEELPYRGSIGSGYNFTVSTREDARSLVRRVESGMRWIWERESEQLMALCAVRARLIEEGWTEIDELREELVGEIKRVRAQRARAQQEGELRLEVEDAARP